MTTPKVTWCEYKGFQKPTHPRPLNEPEAVANLAAQDPAFSEYVAMKIHDPIHMSRIGGDQREHITV